MATTCTNCGCSKPKCGCQDTMLTSPPAYPTPIGCPTPEPCSEVIDAQCVIYTNPDVICNQEVVVETSTSVADAINNIVNYICAQIGNFSELSIKKFAVNTVVDPVSTTYTILRSSLNACQIFDKTACNEQTSGFSCDFIINIYVYNSVSGLWKKLDGSDGVVINADSGPGDIVITIPTLDPDDTQYRTIIIG